MRLLATSLAVVIIFSTAPLFADSLADQVRENPNDAKKLNEYILKKLTTARSKMTSNPDAAEKTLKTADEFLADLEVTEPQANSLRSRGQIAIRSYLSRIKINRITLDEAIADVKENPNDVDKLNLLYSKVASMVSPMITQKPNRAEKLLAQARETLDYAKENSDGAAIQNAVLRIDRSLKTYEARIETARLSLDDVIAKVMADPNNEISLNQLGDKVSTLVSPIMRNDPRAAADIMVKARDTMGFVADNSEDEGIQSLLKQIDRRLKSYDSRIEAGLKHLELIGQPAADLDVEAWVNGEALSQEDLKGKVVLLDFWAVWCGPCIATFPHLQEWQEEYTDKGLVIVGLTNYYNYTWDEEADRATRSQEPVEPVIEQEMLVKFAEQHDLHHVFAIQKEGRDISKFYGVTGIPQAVLIDRAGNVQMIRVGSGDANANALSEKIAELIGE